MIVQCPQCSSRYRVADANVPPTGGRISCPSCGHKFVIYPESPSPASGDSEGYVEDDPGPATEVMTGDALSGIFGGAGPDDGTVEMKNPFSTGGQTQDAKTEVVSGDAADYLADLHSGQGADAGPPTQVESGIEGFGAWDAPSAEPENWSRPTQPVQPVQTSQSVDHVGPRHEQSTGLGQPAAPPLDSGPTIPNPQVTADHLEEEQAPEGYDGPWKLKTNFGLTYEFPDTEGLKRWLENRDELDGYALAGEDGDFKPLDAWPQLAEQDEPMSANRSAPALSGPPTGGPPARPPGFGASAPPPPSQNLGSGAAPGAGSEFGPSATGPRKKINTDETWAAPGTNWNKVLWPVFILMVIVALALALQTTGTYDVKGLILGTPTASVDATQNAAPAGPVGVVEPEEPGAEGAEEPAEVGEPEDPERENKIQREVDRLIDEADEAREKNRLQTALQKLTRAKKLGGERPRVYDMLAEVYTQLGQKEEAKAANEQASELRKPSTPAADLSAP